MKDLSIDCPFSLITARHNSFFPLMEAVRDDS